MDKQSSDDELKLTPVYELPYEWIDDYLDEGSDPEGEPIRSRASYYPGDEEPELLFVFSGLDRGYIEQHLESVSVGAELTAHWVEEEVAEKEERETFDQAEETEALEIAFHDFLMMQELADEGFGDAYYAKLLREHPEAILVTMEPLQYVRSASQMTMLSYQVKTRVDAGKTRHYRSKWQNGASASVTATHGSVTLRMWRSYEKDNHSRYEFHGTQRSVAGGIQDPGLYHQDTNQVSEYDANVRGNRNDSKYTITGDWVLDV